MYRWLVKRWHATPLSVLYRRELEICKSLAVITGWATLLGLIVEAPAIAVAPWAMMFGACLRAVITLPLLITTQEQIEEELRE